MADIIDISALTTEFIADGVKIVESPAVATLVAAEVLNAAWDMGLTQQANLGTKIEGIATGLDENVPIISAPTSIPAPGVTAPMVNIPATVDDYIETYRAQYIEMMDELTTRVQSFRDTYFPDETAGFAAAQSWLTEALSNPDSGLPVAIQDQIFEDDRSRILDDASRASDAVLAAFAARRFPLPPGQAAAAIATIQQKSQAEIATSSRNIAKLAVDMQRFTVEKLLGLRQAADGAALEYVKTLVVAPSESNKVANQQSALIAAAADFYRADIAAAELTSKVAQFNNTLTVDVAGKNQASELAIVGEKIKTLLAEAQYLATSAAALFNNLNVSVGTGGSGPNSRTITTPV